MGDSPPTKPDLVSSRQPKEDTQTSNKRKVAQKTVVRVKTETSSIGKQKGEGPPSDSWSWRKYGQKPIKGSPYPRGYYRCSTSKGCSAKKQVERCRTDPSVLIITYTSDHNHPDPDPPSCTNPSTATTMPHSPSTDEQEVPTTHNTKEPTRTVAPACEKDTTAGNGGAQLQFPHECPEEDVQQSSSTATETEKPAHHPPATLLDQGGALPFPDVKNDSVEPTKPSEDNFFDELEELPAATSFAGWVRSSSFDDRVFLPLPVLLLDY